MNAATATEEPKNAIAQADQAPLPDGNGNAGTADGDASSSTELDLDGFITFPVKLGGERFIAREISIEKNENVVRESPLPPVKPESTSLTDEVLDELRELPTNKRVQRVLTVLDDENTLTIYNLESIIPQARAVLAYASGQNQGEPPSVDFLRDHLRLSTWSKLMKRLGVSDEDEDAEGKS